MPSLPPPPSTPPPPPSPYAGPQGAGPVVGLPKGRGMALAALVCGIAAIPLFFLFVPGAVAVVLGLVAASQIKRSPLPHDGLGKARAGWILGAVASVAFAGLVVAIARGAFGEVAIEDLEPGDCVDLDPAEVNDAEISALPRVECGEPHTGEVILAGELEGGDRYPGMHEVDGEVGRRCSDAMGRYADESVLRRELITYVSAWPHESAWERGDRSFVCIAIRSDGEERTGSIRDDD